MASKQRVFSHPNDNSYKNYIENKNAVTKLSSFKQRSPHLDKFSNYADYINLSKAFFRYQICSKNCEKIPTENLYNSNRSFPIYYEDINQCTNIIYPNAVYYGVAQKPLSLSSNLNLQNWDPCHHRCINPIPIDDLLISCDKCISIRPISDRLVDHKLVDHKLVGNKLFGDKINTIKNSSRCKTGMCKNTKTLFI